MTAFMKRRSNTRASGAHAPKQDRQPREARGGRSNSPRHEQRGARSLRGDRGQRDSGFVRGGRVYHSELGRPARRAFSLGGGYDGDYRSTRREVTFKEAEANRAPANDYDAAIEKDAVLSSLFRDKERPQSRGPRMSSRGGRGGNKRGKKNSFAGDNIDVSRFIQKAVVTEEVEHFVPEHKFADFAIDERLKKNILSRGYDTPTPIQDRAIPQILLGNDVVGIANTGTGKTGAFLIPLIHKVLTNKESKVLILTPTRELAQQIEAELKLVVKALPIYSAVCVGGAYIGAQIKALKYKNEFIIGTPGRIVDLIERRSIILDQFDTIVLDEADRMLDMGFIADMRNIMEAMPKAKQSLLFSATMSKEIEKIIGEFLSEPTRISVKTRETSKNVDQDIVRVENGRHKSEMLMDLLRDPDFDKVLVFARTKSGAERLSDTLRREGFASDSIHGDKSQYLRQKALRLFKENKVKILVATDVAARGLDISNVSHVINYDIPATYEDYVHRIGRTGRGGKTGKALTFID